MSNNDKKGTLLLQRLAKAQIRFNERFSPGAVDESLALQLQRVALRISSWVSGIVFGHPIDNRVEREVEKATRRASNAIAAVTEANRTLQAEAAAGASITVDANALAACNKAIALYCLRNPQELRGEESLRDWWDAAGLQAAGHMVNGAVDTAIQRANSVVTGATVNEDLNKHAARIFAKAIQEYDNSPDGDKKYGLIGATLKLIANEFAGEKRKNTINKNTLDGSAVIIYLEAFKADSTLRQDVNFARFVEERKIHLEASEQILQAFADNSSFAGELNAGERSLVLHALDVTARFNAANANEEVTESGARGGFFVGGYYETVLDKLRTYCDTHPDALKGISQAGFDGLAGELSLVSESAVHTESAPAAPAPAAPAPVAPAPVAPAPVARSTAAPDDNDNDDDDELQR